METTITVLAALFVILGVFAYKNKIGQQAIIALFISALWVSKAGFYDYSGVNSYFLGLNLFPLFAWTAGLVFLRELYEKVRWRPNKFFKVSAVYVICILVVEYIGYNYMNIQLAAGYPGLFGFELMHMPWWGQLYYLAIGPVYLKIADYMGVK